MQYFIDHMIRITVTAEKENRNDKQNQGIRKRNGEHKKEALFLLKKKRYSLYIKEHW